MKTIRQLCMELEQRTAPGSRPPIGPQPDESARCPVCGGDNWRTLRPSEPEYQRDTCVPCEACLPQRRARLRAARQDESGLTESEKKLRLADIVTEGRPGTVQAVQACRDLLEGRAFMLTVWGGYGCGKSAALIATLNEFLDRGCTGLYIPQFDLFNYLQEGMDKGRSVRERQERLRQFQLLAIDEFQVMHGSEWRADQIRSLIDQRWRRGVEGTHWTLLAMNTDPSALEPRLYSRLSDGRNRTGGPPIVHNRDADLRHLLQR